MTSSSMGASQASLATNASSIYNGFDTVNDPKQYLDAPAMLLPTSSANSVAPSVATEAEIEAAAAISGEVSRSIDVGRVMPLLKSDELSSYETELSVLKTRLADVVQQVEVERKMMTAAANLSKLHMEKSPEKEKSQRDRFSKLFSVAHGGDKDKSKRLSRQAKEEASVSTERLRKLETVQNELKIRKLEVEKRLLQHHAAVLALTMLGKPINVPVRSHRRNMSSLSGRQSWISFGQSQSRLSHQSRQSQYSMQSIQYPTSPSRFSTLHSSTVDSSYTSRGSAIASSPAGPGPSKTAVGSVAGSTDDLAAQVARLAKHAASVFPSVPLVPDHVKYLANVFDHVNHEQRHQLAELEAANNQARLAEQRIDYLTGEIQKLETQQRQQQQHEQLSRPLPPIDTELQEALANTRMELAETQNELSTERQRVIELRQRCGAQREELQRVTSSLEDITRLAVSYENQRAEYEQVLAYLEDQLAAHAQEGSEHASESLKTAANPSILCKEFRNIISELTEKHYEETRDLRRKRIDAAGVPGRHQINGAAATANAAAATPNGSALAASRVQISPSKSPETIDGENSSADDLTLL